MLERFDFMFIVAIVLMIVSIAMLIMKFSQRERKYDVFVIEGDKLIVMSGIPTRYIIDDIEMVIFQRNNFGTD